MSADLDALLAERAIQRVLATCSRGVDRFDFEAARACYWPDGTDDHGSSADGYVRGLRSPDDIVHRILDPSRG